MRILVTGKDGQVDTSLQQLGDATPGVEVIRIGLPEVDLSRPETLEAPIRASRPDVIISSAAYTAVDKAENERELAMSINAVSPGELGRLAEALNIPLLHLSTDYVFGGDKVGVYTEADPPAPVSVYGHTKLAGENAIRKATQNYIILRTAWVYSPFGNNFVKTMLRLGEAKDEVSVVADQHGCPTYGREIARALLLIAHRVVVDRDAGLRGIFHLTGQGETTWAGFAEAIFAAAEARGRRPVRVREILTSEYPTPAKRPSNSRLSGKKLSEIYGLQLDPWQVSLNDCLNQLVGQVGEKS